MEDVPLNAVPNEHVSFHLYGRRGVLFDADSQRLYAVNRSAGFIWCWLAEGLAPSEIAQAFAAHGGLAVADAQALVNTAIGRWTTSGLMRRSDEPARSFLSPPRPATQPDLTYSGLARLRPSAGYDILTCEILDTRFELSFGQAVLSDIVVPSIACCFAQDGIAPRTERIHIEMSNGRVDIQRGDMWWWSGPTNQVVPALHAILPRLALEGSTTFPAIHAAAVLGPRGVILFPGASGRGKSTLSAALMAHGYEVLCDDTVVLDTVTLRVRPVGPYLCLKSGSWPVLRAAFPDLCRQPSYRRSDGVAVRFLPLRRAAAKPGRRDIDGFPVLAIVFPRYRAESPTRLIRMRPAAALRRLADCIDPIGRRLDADHIERIIGWVHDTPCYRLPNGSAEAAIRSLGGILR